MMTVRDLRNAMCIRVGFKYFDKWTRDEINVNEMNRKEKFEFRNKKVYQIYPTDNECLMHVYVF